MKIGILVLISSTGTRALLETVFFVIMFNNESEISSIIEASKCMGSDKITERRKNAETLEKLLGNESYVTILDNNTDTSHGFTWNDLFNAARTYMDKVILDKF